MVLAAVLVCLSTVSHAQQMPVDNGDIPTLRKGTAQIDTYFGSFGLQDLNQKSLNTTLRYGFHKNFEAQMTWNSQITKLPDFKLTGDVTTLGIKTYLNKETNYIPALSAIVAASLSIDKDFRLFVPSLNVLFDKTLFGNITTNGNYQLNFNEASNDLSSSYSVNIELAATSWLNAYVGIVGGSPINSLDNSDSQEYIELGALIWLRKNITLYPFYDIGISEGAGNTLNIGLIVRL